MDKLTSIDFYTSDLRPKSKWLLIAIALSLLIHIVFLYNGRFHPHSEETRDDSKTTPLRITLSELRKETPALESSADMTNAAEVNEPPGVTKNNAIGSTIQSKDSLKESIEKNNVTIAKPTKQMNHHRLASVISQTISEDVQAWEQSIWDDCRHQTLRDKQDCDNVKPFDSDTPSKLASVFAESIVGHSQVRQYREQDRLVRLQHTINKSLASATIPKAMEEYLMRELNYVREEQRLADCGGQLEQGTCAGEIDLIRVISSVGKLVKKVQSK